MSHVADGELHAYLDGALDEYPGSEARRVREHLESCAPCRTRLEEERGARDEAERILGLVAPDVEVPTFEELRAYVRANPGSVSTRSARLYRLSWAASVVLALGTGWMLRGTRVGPIVPPRVQAPSSAPVSADGASEGSAPVREEARDAELEATVGGAAAVLLQPPLPSLGGRSEAVEERALRTSSGETVADVPRPTAPAEEPGGGAPRFPAVSSPSSAPGGAGLALGDVVAEAVEPSSPSDVQALPEV